MKLLVALGALLLTCTAFAAPTLQIPDADLVKRIDAILDAAVKRPEAVGLSVAVARNGRLLLERGVGTADLEFDAPANAQTVFRIGSLTKQFTAAGIMKLVERGAVQLDADLHRYVPTFDTGGRTITIRQLLHHASGVPNYTEQPSFWPLNAFRDLPHDQLLGIVKGAKFDFEPGQGSRYSNTGYYLLGMVIEAVSGKSYASFMQDEFFTPLQLKRIRYGSERDIIKNRAQGYAWSTSELKHVNDATISMVNPGGAGGLSASAGDLVRWEIALTQGRSVTPGSFEQMISDGALVGSDGNHYGFGLVVREKPVHTIFHTGGIAGFNSVMSWFPEKNLVIAVISNSEGLLAEGVSEQVYRAATGL